jgi:hypothetical protein
MLLEGEVEVWGGVGGRTEDIVAEGTEDVKELGHGECGEGEDDEGEY